MYSHFNWAKVKHVHCRLPELLWKGYQDSASRKRTWTIFQRALIQEKLIFLSLVPECLRIRLKNVSPSPLKVYVFVCMHRKSLCRGRSNEIITLWDIPANLLQCCLPRVRLTLCALLATDCIQLLLTSTGVLNSYYSPHRFHGKELLVPCLFMCYLRRRNLWCSCFLWGVAIPLGRRRGTCQMHKMLTRLKKLVKCPRLRSPPPEITEAMQQVPDRENPAMWLPAPAHGTPVLQLLWVFSDS